MHPSDGPYDVTTRTLYTAGQDCLAPRRMRCLGWAAAHAGRMGQPDGGEPRVQTRRCSQARAGPTLHALPPPCRGLPDARDTHVGLPPARAAHDVCAPERTRHERIRARAAAAAGRPRHALQHVLKPQRLRARALPFSGQTWLMHGCISLIHSFLPLQRCSAHAPAQSAGSGARGGVRCRDAVAVAARGRAGRLAGRGAP